MIIRRLIVPLTMAVIAVQATQAHAQGAFPAPLPGAAAQQSPDPAFPPVNGAAPSAVIGGAPSAFPSTGAPPVTGGFAQPVNQAGPPGGEDCMNEFVPLREEAEKRGKMIKAASERHAPPDEICKLVKNLLPEAELKMMKFIKSHQQKCGIPPQVAEQMRNGHKNTEGDAEKGLRCGQQQQAQRPGRSHPERSAGFVGGASGSDRGEEKRWHHVRYAERQRARAMTTDERCGGPRC